MVDPLEFESRIPPCKGGVMPDFTMSPSWRGAPESNWFRTVDSRAAFRLLAPLHDGPGPVIRTQTDNGFEPLASSNWARSGW